MYGSARFLVWASFWRFLGFFVGIDSEVKGGYYGYVIRGVMDISSGRM
jgi:hypothetical protein